MCNDSQYCTYNVCKERKRFHDKRINTFRVQAFPNHFPFTPRGPSITDKLEDTYYETLLKSKLAPGLGILEVNYLIDHL